MRRMVTVYCGAILVEPRYLELAYSLGLSLAKNDWGLVSGCSTLGMMGACAEGAISANGYTKGVTLSRFKNFHKGFDEIISVATMRERKRLLIQFADAIIILPGGTGTMDEFFDAIVERSYSFHEKPIILINYGGYWNSMLQQLKHSRGEGFLKENSYFVVVEDSDRAIKLLIDYFSEEY